MKNKNKGFGLISILIAIGIIALVFGGGYYYTQNSQVDENRIYNGNSVEECAVIDYVCEEGWDYFNDETGCGCELTNETENISNETSDWKTYTNEEYGLSFKYPNTWSVKELDPIIDDVNKILHHLDIIDQNNNRRINLSVYGNTPGSYIYETLNENKKNVVVDGNEYIAYLHPNGYECYDRDIIESEGLSCGFFVVPIKKDGLEYRLSGLNTSKITEEDLLFMENFKFTK